MKTFTAIAFALSLAASLSAQHPYDRNLHSVTPDNGPVAGGTPVTIEGDFTFSGIADPCAGPVVYVGGVAVNVTSYNESAIHFTTPAYTAGRFNVSVDRCGARGTIRNAFTFTSNGKSWERVLLPVYLQSDLPGAFGSIWRTTLSGYNNAGDAAFTDHPERNCQYPAASADIPPCFQLVPHGQFTPSVDTDQHVPGRLVYIEPAVNADQFRFNLRVRDISRESSSAGTEVRAVREDDAFGPFEQITLLNIPLGEPYRQKLRIYRLDHALAAASFPAATPINLFFDDNGASLGVRTITLSEEFAGGDFQLYPGYAELDLNSLPELAGHKQANVLIAVTEGRYWAYVSVTNNNTQQITTVSP